MVGQQPGSDGLLPAVGKQLDWLPSLEIDQQSAVDLTLFPRPIINAQNAYRRGGCTGDGAQSAKQGGGADLQAEFGGKPGTDLGAGGQPKCDQRITQPIGHTSIRMHQLWKPFRENLARTGWGATDKFAHRQ